MESTLTLMSYQAQKYLSLGMVPGRDGNDHPIMFPQGTFKTRDGSMTLASGNEKMWRRLCEVLDLDHLAEDERYIDNAARMANRKELRDEIEAALSTRSAEEWIPVINRQVSHAVRYSTSNRHSPTRSPLRSTWSRRSSIRRWAT